MEPGVINVHDYLIEQPGKDWADLLSGYAGILPAEITVWMVNRFGDLIFVSGDGSVHLLDTGSCVITRLASSRDEFFEAIDATDNANNWLMIPVVDRCVEAGLILNENECYGFKMPPILGGKHELANIVPTDLKAHYSFLADMFQQTKDVPDGAKIRLVIERPPQNASMS